MQRAGNNQATQVDRRVLAALILTLIITAWILYRVIRLSSPDMVENYPYMFPDSFDWVTNGLYYLDLWWRHLPAAIPTIRQPLFTFLTTFSYLAGYPVLLLILSQLAILSAIYFLYKTLTLLKVRPALVILSIIFIALNHSFNLFRLYLMSDPLCIFFLTLSTYLYLLAFDGTVLKWRYLIYASLTSALGSATQYFGLFSTIAFCAVLCIWSLVYRRREWLFAAIVPGLIALAPLGLWALFKKLHFGAFDATQVNHLTYLELSFNNFGFYMNVWPIFFMPLIVALPLLLLAYGVRTPKTKISFSLYFFLLLNALFFLFVFIYQWNESRFTTFFLIQSVTLYALLCEKFLKRRKGVKILLFLCIFLCAYISLTPTDDLMRPKLWAFLNNVKNPNKTLTKNFVLNLARARRERRFKENRCIQTSDGKRFVAPGCDAYITSNQIKYLEYRSSI